MYRQAMNRLKNNNSPQARNMLEMIDKGDISGIESFGRNVAQSRGVDFDSEFAKFKSQFGFK
jgi:phage head maturation protease